MSRLKFHRCPCSFCKYDVISSPDTDGEYEGIDEHMRRLEGRLVASLDALAMIRDGRLGAMDVREYARLYLEIDPVRRT